MKTGVITKEFSGNGVEMQEYSGLVKIRIAHRERGSVLVPDQLYLDSPAVWFQPNTFMPCLIARFDDDIRGRFLLDIDGGHTLTVMLRDSDIVNGLPDGSYLYRATILGPPDLPSFAAGQWAMIKSRPHVRLYHHTNQKAKLSIEESLEFWASPWNFRGTRKLINVGYAYFTSLVTIRSRQDLADIAMSPDKKLHYIRDGAEDPGQLPVDWKQTEMAKDILELDVYWSSSEQRDQTVAVYVDCSVLAPHHVWCHVNHQVWFEVVLPRVFRVGLEPGASLSFSDQHIVSEQRQLKRFDYMIIGDANTLKGLAAPMDEEGTTERFKLHDPGGCLLKFWCDQPNLDHYASLVPEEQELEP